MSGTPTIRYDAYSRVEVSALGRCPVLVERDDELRALSALAGEVARSGGSHAVVITGEAGTGKSRLAQEFASSLPDGWSARTVRLTRSGATLPPLPDARPLAFVLDDAHFLDPAAFEALSGLLDGLGPAAVLLLLTFRIGLHRAGSAEMRALAALARDPRCRELRLVPLSPAGVAQMAAAMGRRAANDLYRRTGGNPFWAEEVLRGGSDVTWTVVETVVAQLDALPPPARELACALAVAEEPVPVSAAARLVPELTGACAALTGAGLLQDGTDGLGLRHALVGEAVLAGLERPERAGWHRRLAAALEGERVEADRLARLWAGAGEAERAAEVARPAASELRANGASRRAFECFAIALERPPADHEAAGALHEEAALTAARIGERDAMRRWIAVADRHYREAGQEDRAVRMLLDPTFDYLPVGRARAIRDEPVERLLADALASLGRRDPAAAHTLMDAAVEAARARSDGMALARAARLVMFGLGEFERGDSLLDEALACPNMAHHPGRESRVLTIRACGLMARGYALEALELLRQGAAISRQEPEAVLWTGHLALGDALQNVGRVEEGVAMLAEAARARWTDRVVDLAEGQRRFEGGDAAGGLAAIRTATAGILTELDFDPLGRAVVGSRILRAQALAEAHGGQPDAALGTVRQLDVLSPEPFNDVSADLAYVVARAGAALGSASVLAEASGRIGEIVRVATGPGTIGAAEAVRGFAALAGGRTDEAGRHLAAAAALYDRAPRAVLAAELWCDAALAAGPSGAAEAFLEQASRACESNGLVRLAARVAAVREGLAARRPSAHAVLSELTPRERDVVLLVADGLSNREVGGRLYLAEGTVRNYLSTAFDKLGVSRRAELARLIASSRRPGER